jgi:hypothetical protein
MNRRMVATALLVALFAVFGMAHPVQHDADQVAPHAMASVAAPTLPAPHTTPELPLAGAETAEHPPVEPRADHVEQAVDAPLRAHRQPAADRAPPART